MNGTLSRLVRRVADVKEQEVAPVIWSAAYYFFVLSAYSILRPIRDEVAVTIMEGAKGRAEDLSWMFSATLGGILLVHPIFTYFASKLPRKRFVPLTYRFFILHLLIFFGFYKLVEPTHGVWIGRVFYVWVSVFNLFVVSVFWSFVNDLFRPGQSKRLFGVVAVGGSIGAITGSSITKTLAEPLGAVNLLLVSALLLELACYASRSLERHEAALRVAGESDGPQVVQPPENKGAEPIGGKFFDGIKSVATSPYLLGISGLMLLFSISATFIYFQQTGIIAKEYSNKEQRTELLATRDLIVNTLALVTQLFLTGRVLRWFGIGIALAFLPALSLVGFALLGVWPGLAAVMLLDILRRSGNFAIQRPAREALYSVLARGDKYKAKNFNDTFVYRFGDQVGAWLYPLMIWLGLEASGISFSMVPLAIIWLFLALWIGRKYLRLHDQQTPRPAVDDTSKA